MNERIIVRVTDKKEIEDRAEELGFKSVSDYIRHLINEDLADEF